MDYIIWNFSLTDKPRMSHTLTLRSITVLKKTNKIHLGQKSILLG